MGSPSELIRIAVITQGDSRKIDCWSNVPYFLCKNLESQGIKIYRINADLDSFLLKIVRKIFNFYFYIIKKNKLFNFNRSYLYCFLQNRKLKKEMRKIDSQIDVYISLCFNLPIYRFSKKQYFLYGDWNYDYLVRIINHRTPFKYEEKYIEMEYCNIRRAKRVVCMFLSVQWFLAHNGNKNLCFLGNTINLPVELSPQPSIIGNKYEKNIYLFIGTKKYIKSALQLANAIIELNKTTSGKVVGHFIGISSKDFPFENPDIICHGYLSKSNPEQFQLYISLLESSKFIVNTTNGWAGINSLVEAMFFYTPVIVSTFEEFVDHFGQQIDFGFYCESSLFSTILESYRISYDEYFKLCENSHNRVRCWNWLSFTQKLILEIK